MIIKAGTLLTIQYGFYSVFVGPFHVLKAFDQQEALNAYKAQAKPGREVDGGPSAEGFISYLAETGIIKKCQNSLDWDLGDGQDASLDDPINEADVETIRMQKP